MLNIEETFWKVSADVQKISERNFLGRRVYVREGLSINKNFSIRITGTQVIKRCGWQLK